MQYVLIALSLFALSACSSTGLSPSAPSGTGMIEDYAVDENALETLKERYEADPQSPDAVRKYAGGLYIAKDYETAIKILTSFVEHDDAEAKDYYFYAKVLQENEHNNLAKTWLSKALDESPEMTAARLMLAEIYEEEEEWVAAEMLYKDALANDKLKALSEHDHIQLSLGHILNLVSQKRVKDAGLHMSALKEQYPKNIQVERNRRIVLAMMQSHGHSAPKPAPRPKRD